MSDDTKEKAAGTPDPLRVWRRRHPRDSEILAVLEVDWPGTREVCRNAIGYILHRLPATEHRDRVIARSLSVALHAYQHRLTVHDPCVRDVDRLNAFLGALVSELRTRVPGDHPAEPALVRQLIPANLLRVLEREESGDDAA